MLTFAELPAYVQGLIGLCIVLLLFATVINAIMEITHGRLKYVYILALLGALQYVAFQCICDICSHMPPLYNFLNELEEAFGRIPLWQLLLLLLFVTLLEAFILSRNQKWERENITPTSIKEAVDDLPIGICCYAPNGQVMMKNRMMESICQAYTGAPLLNAVAFARALFSSENSAENEAVIIQSQDKVFSVSDSRFSDEEPLLRVMTATDITEQYKKTKRLKAQQELVVRLNKELCEYGKQIVSSITAKEVLNAKVKLHDELGANLLAIKRYLVNGGSTEERIAIENILHRNLQYLKNGTTTKEKDEFAVILDTAEKLDMKIKIIGELTETEPLRHVLVTGIHECLTNTIRHAGGDELTVLLEEEADMLIAKFTNNGKTPEDEIQERGGLALLRALAEESGGTMQILSKPQFELIIKLPKTEPNHVI